MPARRVRPSSAEVALDARDQLGESPYWDEETGQLVRADIARGRVHGWTPATGATWTLTLDGEVGAVVPRAGGGHLLAVDRTLVARAAGGLQRVLAHIDEPSDNRFNDCRCDPAGRLWAGTMSKARATGTAALYRLEGGRALERIVSPTTISNGLGWSPAGDAMYFVDSTTQRLDAFDFDAATGAVSNRRTLAEVEATDGLPDGLAVDAEGGIWLCLFGGAALHRYDARGTLDAVVPLPVTNPTCPAFGGPGLATLYVTSARHRLSPAQLAAEPHAGALLVLDPGVRGMPASRFAG